MIFREYNYLIGEQITMFFSNHMNFETLLTTKTKNLLDFKLHGLPPMQRFCFRSVSSTAVMLKES